MSDETSTVFKIACSCCGQVLWVDSISQTVIKTEKGRKKTSSMEELLLKEKKKKEEADQLFASSSALEKKKRSEAKKQFDKVFAEIEPED